MARPRAVLAAAMSRAVEPHASKPPCFSKFAQDFRHDGHRCGGAVWNFGWLLRRKSTGASSQCAIISFGLVSSSSRTASMTSRSVCFPPLHLPPAARIFHGKYLISLTETHRAHEARFFSGKTRRFSPGSTPGCPLSTLQRISWSFCLSITSDRPLHSSSKAPGHQNSPARLPAY